jgi:hypothetical protein
MPYIKDDDGRLNNFAKEPKVYQAEPANPEQQRNFIILAIVGAILVSVLIFVASKV